MKKSTYWPFMDQLKLYRDLPTQILAKILQRGFRLAFRIIQAVSPLGREKTSLFLVAPGISQVNRDELLRRLSFYQPANLTLKLVDQQSIPWRAVFSSEPVLVFGPRSRLADWLVSVRPGTFDVDYHTSPKDGWAWTELASFLDPEPVDLAASRQVFTAWLTRMKQNPKERCYIFGTGPSLEKAINLNWEDGYRIVCNTIARDHELWDHLHPDIIVAGDAIYHFGFTSYARAFRRDLRERLLAGDTLFVYPLQFHAIVRREFAGLEKQLVPVPTGVNRRVDVDLLKTFQLPNLGNVLGLLLLPLACTLSKHVCLWGFDGRAPNDKLFWSNSNKHSYPEHMEELQQTHPRFFEHYVPASNPNKYVQAVQGDLLDDSLKIAEKLGWTFEMMHPSWTPTLQKRYRKTDQNGI